MATDKKQCSKGCFWCESPYSPMGQCADEMGAKFLPPTAFVCKKVKNEAELEDTVVNANVCALLVLLQLLQRLAG